MFKQSTILILLSFFFIYEALLAYDYLYVRDPRGWHSSQGTIEKAVVTMRPVGLYTEVGLYLTFSAKGWYYDMNDTLEVEYNFELPENSIVHDSWLWIEDEIIRGEIFDKWTAASIYEDIVKRRRDPSILYKRSETHYELRIFPMVASETRKVKISYLVPTEWNSNSVIANLPVNLLRPSRYPVYHLYVLTWLGDEWKNPKIMEHSDIEFLSLSDDTFGDYELADIPSPYLQDNLSFSLDSPLKDGIYVNRYGEENEGIFQLAFLPSQALNLSSNNKVAILFDYDASNTDMSTTEILNMVKINLLSKFDENDQFNLIFSNLNIKRISDTWLPADAATVENTFENLGSDPISTYSNLPSLLANGIQFVKDNGNDGSIILVSSSDQMGDYIVANQLLEDLQNLNSNNIPIHVADLQNRNYNWNYIGGRSYSGNEYLYTNITRLTTGNYFSYFYSNNNSLPIEKVFTTIGGLINSFDLHTGLENGYCYGRYNIGNLSSSTYADEAILQIGKYKGQFPLAIEASGEYKGDVFSQTVMINENEIGVSDSLLEEIWAGNYVQYLESQPQTNDIVNEIVDYSLSERVLSIYSAFLCLEPARGGEVCYDCLDESELVSVKDENDVQSDSIFVAYPNPFNGQVSINVSLPGLTKSQNTSFKIYNILGQEVKTFYLDEKSTSGKYLFNWDGRNDSGSSVSSGTYLFVVNTGKKTHSLKLLYVK